MASVWAYQESCSDREVIGHVVVYVSYPDKFEAAPVRPEDVIASQAEGGSLSDLCPSIQVPKPAALLELMDQVNNT